MMILFRLGRKPSSKFYCWQQLPYSGKFSYGANFRIFRMLHPLYENKNCENLNVQNFFLSRVTFDLYAYHSHKRSLAACAKCKTSSLNDVSLSILCQGVETK